MTAVTMDRSSTVYDAIMVFKPRIAFAIMLSAMGGIAVAQGTLPASCSLSCCRLRSFWPLAPPGRSTNGWKADLDGRMKRTASRPFATGQFRAGAGWLSAILAVLAVAVVIAGLATNWWAALYTFLGAFTYGVVYTIWLKRRTWTNIVVGGLAGSFAVLAGAAAVNPSIGIEALLLTIVLFLWTPPHFWSLAMVASDDYQEAGVPMLPVVAGDRLCALVILAHTATLSLLALVPAFFGMGSIYLVSAIAGGGLFTWTSIRLAARPTRGNALKNFLMSLLQLCLLLIGAMIDRAYYGAF